MNFFTPDISYVNLSCYSALMSQAFTNGCDYLRHAYLIVFIFLEKSVDNIVGKCGSEVVKNYLKVMARFIELWL
ncbi:hypothetical protein D0894_15200 [Pseudomonas monteilii]|uniref:Uncharacterized protein n=1 Tax=Pseudomonas monteilii TaxID=76759 RepID=A0A399M4S6_9PSED|nr:hypothetical protein D0894_15200 [Pseudomonas monteilii]